MILNTVVYKNIETFVIVVVKKKLDSVDSRYVLPKIY